MRVLVTGAGGFSGGHVARRLARAGFEVLALTRTSPVAPPAHPESAQRFRSLQADLADPDTLPEDIDAVVHAAATSIWRGITVDRMIHDNVLATRMLVEHALAAGARRFVFFSSMSAFGRVERPVAEETTPVTDPDAYGATKLLCEQLLQDVAEDLPSVSLRLPSVIGRGAHRNWPSETLRKLKLNEPLAYYNPHAAYNNAVHEADLSALIGGLLQRELSGADMIVLGAAGQIEVAGLVERMAVRTGSDSPLSVVEGPRAPFTIDCTKAVRDYGYAPMEIGAMIDRFVTENLES